MQISFTGQMVALGRILGDEEPFIGSNEVVVRQEVGPTRRDTHVVGITDEQARSLASGMFGPVRITIELVKAEG